MAKKFFFGLAVALVVLGSGIAIGWLVGKNSKTVRTISSQTIVSALQERGFLVTETAVSTVSVIIKTENDSIWRRILWGHEINASGVVEVNWGVDLIRITEDDVVLENNKLILTIEPVEIFNSRVIGDINLENKQGILKRLFEHDDGYNQAQSKLIGQAEDSIFDFETFTRANSKAIEEIKRLLKFIAPDKEIIVLISDE